MPAKCGEHFVAVRAPGDEEAAERGQRACAASGKRSTPSGPISWRRMASQGMCRRRPKSQRSMPDSPSLERHRHEEPPRGRGHGEHGQDGQVRVAREQADRDAQGQQADRHQRRAERIVADRPTLPPQRRRRLRRHGRRVFLRAAGHATWHCGVGGCRTGPRDVSPADRSATGGRLSTHPLGLAFGAVADAVAGLRLQYAFALPVRGGSSDRLSASGPRIYRRTTAIMYKGLCSLAEHSTTDMVVVAGAAIFR